MNILVQSTNITVFKKHVKIFIIKLVKNRKNIRVKKLKVKLHL